MHHLLLSSLSFVQTSLTNISFLVPFRIFSRTLLLVTPFDAGGKPRRILHSSDLFRNVFACLSTCARCDRNSPLRRSPTALDSFDRLNSSPSASALQMRTRIVSSPPTPSSLSLSVHVGLVSLDCRADLLLLVHVAALPEAEVFPNLVVITVQVYCLQR